MEHDRVEIGAVIKLTLVEEMEFIDVFVIHLFTNDTFWQHAVVHDKLVLYDVVILVLMKEIESQMHS